MVVMHLCDNPPCVRPDHLRLGTHADNVADKVSKGRQAKGVDNGRAVLDPDKVRRVRSMATAGMNPHAIGKVFGVDRKTIVYILAGQTWRDVT